MAGFAIPTTGTPQPGTPGGAIPGMTPGFGVAAPVNNGNPYSIGGALPFSGMGAAGNFDFSGNPASLSQNYAQSYQSALALNSQNYQNILSGFQTTLQNQAGQQGALQQGYGNLGAGIQNTIAGITSSQQALINKQYAQQSGAATQGLINAGLGNSTVMPSVQRGISLDQSLASNNLANQMAGLSAGYQSQIGLAGLGQQAHNIDANTGEANQQLAWMNSVNAPYPNAGLYGELAQQWGAAQQANANRAQAADQFSQLLAASRRTLPGQGGGGGGMATGYMPGQTPGLFAGSAGGTSYMPGGVGLGTSYSGYGASPGSISVPDQTAWGGGGDWGGQQDFTYLDEGAAQADPWADSEYAYTDY